MKKSKKNFRVALSTVETATEIFKGFQRIEIIFLLAKQGSMNIQEIRKGTGCPVSLISYHLEKLEGIGIVEKDYQTLSDNHTRKKELTKIFFRINKDIQKELTKIVDSVTQIEDVFKKYKKERGRKKIKEQCLL